MHPATGVELGALAKDHYAVFSRLSVADTLDTTFQSPVLVSSFLGMDPFISGTITADLDQPVMQSTITCHLGSGATNLSPHMFAGAQWNGRPLLDPGRRIQLETKCVSYGYGGVPEGDIPWRPVFQGRIDSADPIDDVLKLDCRDTFSDLLDSWIPEGPDEQGGWPMPDQRIDTLLWGPPGIDFNNLALTRQTLIGLGMGGAGLNFYPHFANGIPTLQIPAYRQMPGSTLLAMRDAALQSGWDLRGRWGSPVHGNDVWVLWYYEPDRSLAFPGTSIGPDRYFEVRNLAKSRDEVRNEIHVTPSNPPRIPVVRDDKVSIIKYGRRYLAVSEDATSHIVAADQATALATAILSDLKEPKIGAELVTRYFPFVEINDRYVLQPLPLDPSIPFTPVYHDQTIDVAISGFTHTIDGPDPTTVLRTRSIPAAANEEWRNPTPRKLYVQTALQPAGVAEPGAIWVTL